MDNHMDFNEVKVASWGRLKNYVLHTDTDKKEKVSKLYDNIKAYTDKPEPVVVPKHVYKSRTNDKFTSRNAKDFLKSHPSTKRS